MATKAKKRTPGQQLPVTEVMHVKNVNQSVEIDGQRSEQICKVVLDEKKGNVKITLQISTKQLSFGQTGREIALSMAALQLATAYDVALEFKRMYLETRGSQGDEDQIPIPFDGEQLGEGEQGYYSIDDANEGEEN